MALRIITFSADVDTLVEEMYDLLEKDFTKQCLSFIIPSRTGREKVALKATDLSGDTLVVKIFHL